MASSTSLYTSETPSEISSAKGIHLMTMSTPNGQKVQIMLEELKAKYSDFDFTYNTLNIMTNEQKKDYYLRINPNGRIPVIIDNTVSPPHPIHETSAELMYLQSKFDKKNEFAFTDPIETSEMLTWLFFWHGSGAPYMGQFNHFNKAAKEKIPYAIKRFHDETFRVLGVLEIRLSGKYTGEPREYLAGKGKGKYSIADIGTWTWAKNYKGTLTDDEIKTLPHFVKYVDRIAEREAVKTGISEKYATK